MAKKTRIPKKVAGIKVPKALRRSKMLRNLLSSDMGRNIVADALVAGAGAAASTLIGERRQVAEAAGNVAQGTARGGKRAVGLVGEAIEAAADAVFTVVTDAARSIAPDDKKRGRQARSGAGKKRTRQQDHDDHDTTLDASDVRH